MGKTPGYVYRDFHSLTRIDLLKELEKLLDPKEHNKCLVLEHGNGNHSGEKGPVLKRNIRNFFKKCLEEGKVLRVIHGGEFNTSVKHIELKQAYPELSAFLDQGNDGITIIEIR